VSDRPADWSAVGRDGDPTPGDPVVVRDGGQKYQNIASALARAAATLRQMNGGASSGSDSVVALLENCDEIADQLSTAQARYQTTGDALVTYAYTLDQIQSTTLQALMTANRARDSMAENTRLADQYARWASYADTPERAEEQARYLRLEATYRTAAGDDQATIDQQKHIIDQAVADRDQAAHTAIAQIEDVTSSDGLNDSWWDDWGAKLVEWISTIAEAVASIAGILALVLCWVPVLGQALMAIAAVAGIVAAAANIVLAATGEKSWGEAIISIAFAALGCVGLGGTRGILGALRGGARLSRGGLPAFAAVFKTGGASVKASATTVRNVKAANSLYRNRLTVPQKILNKTLDDALDPHQFVMRIAKKYGINLRGSGQDIKVEFLDHMPTGNPGRCYENMPGVIFIATLDNFRDSHEIAITLAHELNHARGYLRGLKTADVTEEAAYASEGAFIEWIGGLR